MKEDITNSPRFQRILHEAAEYRLLRDIFKSAERRVADAKDADTGKSGLRIDTDPNSN